MKRQSFACAAVAVLGITAASFVHGDVLRLKDGTSVEGDVKRGDAGWSVVLPDGRTMDVPTESVLSLEAGADVKPGEPMAGLASLRRSTENQSDLRVIIDKYNRFIGQYPGTPAATEAIRDLAMWQERLTKDMVRVGRAWVTRGEREQMQQQALQLADQARQRIKEGKWSEAGKLVEDALNVDPQSVTALYLRALVEYQLGQYVAARKDLELVKSLTPNHGPTLNNLGVITARQKRLGEAVSYLEQAMRAAPADRTILDNVAETLHAVAEDSSMQQRVQRALAQRTTATFDQQDPALAAKMKQQGLNRWGATWVTDAEMAKLQEAQRQIDQKIAAIQADFDATNQQIAGIDQRMSADDATLRQLEAQSYRQDLVTGRTFFVPLPPLYDEIQRDIANMRVTRQQAVAKLDGLRQQAQSVQRDLPIAKYTGMLQVVGPDGAPIQLATPTADAVATKPAQGG